MRATPFSKENYFPMLLSNGADAILADYSGSIMSGMPGHRHAEQFQSCTLGWYKIGHSDVQHPRLQPVIRSGYQVAVRGEVWDISDYEQTFDPLRAVLTTKVLAGGVRLEIETFLTDDGILVEHYRFLKTPCKDVGLHFYVSESWTGMHAIDFPKKTSGKTRYRNGRLYFNYEADDRKGAGILMTDRNPDGSDTCFGECNGQSFQGGGMVFRNVSPGFAVTRYLSLADTSDTPNYKQKIRQCELLCEKGYARTFRDHEKNWQAFGRASDVSIPDSRMQYVYDLSRYVLRGNLHPRTGAITIGMLPHLWGGGLCVPYDAFFTHQALLQTNHPQEGRSHLEFYTRQTPTIQKKCRSLNIKGLAFSGWSNCFGEHNRSGDFKQSILHEKPIMSAFVLLKYYWQWVFDPQPISKLQTTVIHGLLDLAIDRIIEERDDIAVICPCRAGNESAMDVENDTFTGIAFARALQGAGEMLETAGDSSAGRYRVLGQKLEKGWRQNFRDGVLHLFPGSDYLGCLQSDFFLINLPGGIGKKSIDVSYRKGRTVWGVRCDQPEEGYRDWPWLDMRAAIAYAHLGDGKNSFRWLRNSLKYVSALGAFPEKIRMDGFPIGYWYSTPHALWVWAINAALCCDGPDNHLNLLQGLDGKWQDLSFKNLRRAGGLLISGQLKKGRLVELMIENTSSRPQTRKLRLNSLYRGKMDQTVDIPPRKKITIGGGAK